MDAPTSIGTTLIPGGVRVTWIDNGDSNCVYEIWGSVDGGTSAMVGVKPSGVQSFDHLRERGVDMVYKVRARKNNTISAFSTATGVSPLIFTLTSQGDGSGVAYFKIQVSETTTATLSGTAKFYSDTTGTQNESSTYQFISGALREIYIKVPSGTATLKIKNVITKWGNGDQGPGSGWVTAYPGGPCPRTWADYPNIDIDIALLTHLTCLNLFGNNTVHGEMPNKANITYIELGNGYGGINSCWYTDPGKGCKIGGDISLFTSLWCLDAWDSNSFYGDANNNILIIWMGGLNTTHINLETKSLLYFYENSSDGNTDHGDISARTLMTYFKTGGLCTCSGSILALTKLNLAQLYGEHTTITVPRVNNLKDLSYLDITGLVLTSANVNQILADIRANKDEAKTQLYRLIGLVGAAGTGAPTGQGITDAAYLAAYRTPNNDGAYDLWTVTTR